MSEDFISEEATELPPESIGKRGYFWTTAEIAILTKHYPESGSKRCEELLPHRGFAAIYGKAQQLGLKAPAVSPTIGKRFAKLYPPDERIDQMLRDGYQRAKHKGDITAMSIRIGRPTWWCQKRAVVLGLTKLKAKGKPWTKSEEAIVEQWAICDIKVIANKLKAAGFHRTPTAVATHLKRMKLDRHDPDTWSAKELAGLLGVTGSTVCDWIDRRGLKANTKNWGPGVMYRITRKNFRAWLVENHGYVDLRKVDQPWFMDILIGSTL